MLEQSLSTNKLLFAIFMLFCPLRTIYIYLSSSHEKTLVKTWAVLVASLVVCSWPRAGWAGDGAVSARWSEGAGGRAAAAGRWRSQHGHPPRFWFSCPHVTARSGAAGV